jgi:hypothetical protein
VIVRWRPQAGKRGDSAAILFWRVSPIALATLSLSTSETTPQPYNGTDNPIPQGNPKSEVHASITTGRLLCSNDKHGRRSGSACSTLTGARFILRAG